MIILRRVCSKRITQVLCLLLCLFFFCSPLANLYAQESPPSATGSIQESGQESGIKPQDFLKTLGEGSGDSPNILTMISVIAMVALLPFAVILLTSFVKIVIVLSLLRNALGVQQAPPNQALNGVALLMTIYVMFSHRTCDV